MVCRSEEVHHRAARSRIPLPSFPWLPDSHGRKDWGELLHRAPAGNGDGDLETRWRFGGQANARYLENDRETWNPEKNRAYAGTVTQEQIQKQNAVNQDSVAISWNAENQLPNAIRLEGEPGQGEWSCRIRYLLS